MLEVPPSQKFSNDFSGTKEEVASLENVGLSLI